MTSDLELWLRGLWRHPNPCRHARVKVYEAYEECKTLYRCLDCGLEAQVDRVLLLINGGRQAPILEWGMPRT